MAKTYFEKLKDPQWQKRRLEIMEKSNFLCARCFDGDATLHIHHRIYRKKKQPWEYSDDELECLCEDCHLGAENDKQTVLEAMADPSIEPFLVSIAAEMINKGPLFEALGHLSLLMFKSVHSSLPTVPIPRQRKESLVKIAKYNRVFIASMKTSMEHFLDEFEKQVEAIKTFEP